MNDGDITVILNSAFLITVFILKMKAEDELKVPVFKTDTVQLNVSEEMPEKVLNYILISKLKIH